MVFQISEPLVGDGMAATLQLLQQRGVVSLDSIVGRKSDLKGEHILERVKDPAPKLRLNYVDEFGAGVTETVSLLDEMNTVEPVEANLLARFNSL